MVLRKFVEGCAAQKEGPGQYQLANGRADETGTHGVGVVDDFVPVDSAATERLWQEVEDRLNRAVAAALNGARLTGMLCAENARGA